MEESSRSSGKLKLFPVTEPERSPRIHKSSTLCISKINFVSIIFCLNVINCLFSSGLPIIILYAFNVSFLHSTCHAHHNPIHLIPLTILLLDYKLQSSPLNNFSPMIFLLCLICRSLSTLVYLSFLRATQRNIGHFLSCSHSTHDSPLFHGNDVFLFHSFLRCLYLRERISRVTTSTFILVLNAGHFKALHT
jgi:hypothetical protein